MTLSKVFNKFIGKKIPLVRYKAHFTSGTLPDYNDPTLQTIYLEAKKHNFWLAIEFNSLNSLKSEDRDHKVIMHIKPDNKKTATITGFTHG